MPYIGRAATNTGNVRYLDDIASGFDGSDTTFTAQVGGVNITPDQESVKIFLDGVFQHPGSGNAYTISGSTITFTAAPVANTVFSAYVVGAGAYLDDNAVSSAKLDDDAVTASKLDDDGTGFQVGDLGVGGSLTSGDKLTVTGRLRASGGIIGDLTGNVTGNASGTALTVTQAAQTAITSVGTLTGLTVAAHTLINPSASTSSYLQFATGGTTYGYVGSESSIVSGGTAADMTIGASGDTNLTLTTNGAVRATLNSSGTTFSGNITMPAGNAIYLDGGGNSKIEEFATDKVNIQAGGENLVLLGNGSSAFVGVGTTTPAQAITIKHPEPTILFIHEHSSDEEIGFIGDCANFLTGSSPSATSFGIRSTGDFRIGTGGNNLRMTIGSDGEVQCYDNLKLRNATAASTNGQSLPGYLEFDGYGWDTNSGSDPIKARISMSGSYSGITSGGVIPQINFAIQNSGDAGSTSESLDTHMVVRGDGNVGIGTTSPVSPSGYGTTLALSSGGEGPAITFEDTGETNKKKYILNQSGNIKIGNMDDNGGGVSHHMQIADSGIVGIGINPSTYALKVDNAGNSGIFAGGVMSCGSFDNRSDLRLKENIQPLEESLSVVNQLKPVTFNLKEEKFADEKFAGFIAQEVKESYPIAVREEETDDKYLSIKMMDMIALLTKGMQELSAKVKALESA